jgi:hypothetical protein
MIRVSIVCDRCGAVGIYWDGPHRRPAYKMRSDLHYVGWRAGTVEGRDYCPECKQWAINNAKGKRTLRAYDGKGE